MTFTSLTLEEADVKFTTTLYCDDAAAPLRCATIESSRSAYCYILARPGKSFRVGVQQVVAGDHRPSERKSFECAVSVDGVHIRTALCTKGRRINLPRHGHHAENAHKFVFSPDQAEGGSEDAGDANHHRLLRRSIQIRLRFKTHVRLVDSRSPDGPFQNYNSEYLNQNKNDCYIFTFFYLPQFELVARRLVPEYPSPAVSDYDPDIFGIDSPDSQRTRTSAGSAEAMAFSDDRDSEDVIMQHVSYHEHNYVEEDEVDGGTSEQEDEGDETEQEDEEQQQQQQHNEDLHESHEPANERATEAAPDSDGDEQLEGDGQDDERPDDQDQDDERPSPVQESDDEMDTGAGYNHPMAYPKSYWPGSQRVGLEINPALKPYYEFPIIQPAKRLRNNPRMLAAQKRQLQSHINQEFNLLNNQHQCELVEVTQHEHARLLKKKRSAGLSSDVLQYKVIRSRTVRNLKKRHRREANDTQRAALWAKNAQELKFLQDQLLD